MWSPTRINSWSTAFHYLSKQRSNSKIKKSTLILYADDTVVSSKGSIETVGRKHGAALAAVAGWFHKNKFTINTTKTKHMVFGKGRNLNQHRTTIDQAEIGQLF